jgi:predicted dehydrogenase
MLADKGYQLSDKVHFGVLGTARIVPIALLRPAAALADMTDITAVASRSGERSYSFARKHRIGTHYSSYAELLRDRTVNAVYIAVPNGLHVRWAREALNAGKHVLCEKPLAMNADQAMELSEIARSRGLVLAEAMHFRYHPLADRVQEIVRSGELGIVSHIEAHVSFPILRRSDIRYDLTLGGGATMDQGCYAVSLVRLAAGEEPRVRSAEARLAGPGVDRFMSADLGFPSGATGKVVSSIWSSELFRCSLVVRGSRGELRVRNPVAPQLFHSVTCTADGRKRQERLPRRPTYEYQLEAFAASVLNGVPIRTNAAEAAANLRVMDEMYIRAGLAPRTGVAETPVGSS